MARNLEGRITELEQSTPKGYTTFGADGKPVIQSALPTKDWVQWAINLFRSRRTAQKEALLDQIERSVGPDSGGGLLYQYIAAVYHGPIEEKKK